MLDGISDARGAVVSYPFMDAREACSRLQQSAERFLPCFERLLGQNASHAPHAVGAGQPNLKMIYVQSRFVTGVHTLSS